MSCLAEAELFFVNFLFFIFHKLLFIMMGLFAFSACFSLWDSLELMAFLRMIRMKLLSLIYPLWEFIQKFMCHSLRFNSVTSM